MAVGEEKTQMTIEGIIHQARAALDAEFGEGYAEAHERALGSTITTIAHLRHTELLHSKREEMLDKKEKLLGRVEANLAERKRDLDRFEARARGGPKLAEVVPLNEGKDDNPSIPE